MKQIILEQFSIDEFKLFIEEIVRSEFSKIKLITPPQTEEYLLTRKEVSKLLKISYVTIAEWTKCGKLTAYVLGKNRIRFKKDEVLSFLSNKK